ncbi:MAG TPA: hypothetical protein VMH88_10695 [Gemmatimonadales bacterium]|nr:hypothetical protein [Gemmatimonadales bacterium]
MISFGRSFGLAVTLVGAILGAACSNSTSPSSSPALSVAQSDTVGQVLTSDAQGEIDFATVSGTAAVFPALRADIVLSPPPPCVSRSPASPANSDADPVPDSVRITFADCVATFPASSDTVSGTIDIFDPTPTVTDHAWKHIFTDLTRVHVGPLGRESIITFNGTRQGSRDSAQIAFTSTNVSTTWQWPSGGTASHERSWTLLFTADAAGTIVPDSALPSGSLTIAGTSTWTRGARSWTIDVTTPSALHYDASCTVRPKFDSGTIAAVVTRGANTSHLSIQFTACGQYTVTRS